MRFTKIRKTVAVLLLFALLFSTFPMSALANDNPEETAATDETATVETTAAPTDGCLETEQATGLEPESTGEDEQDLMWVINPETGALELVRGLHHRLIRSNTVTNGWGGIYARQGAGSVSFTYTRANNTTATFSLNAAYDDSGDMYGIGIVHYLLYSTTNDTLSTVTQAPVAYCIDPAKTTANYMHYENDSEYHYMMTDVLSNDKLNAIKLACAYGWPYGFSDAYSTTQEVAFKRQFATQIIIWEIVMGLRGTSGTYAATDNRLYDHYAGVPWSSYYGSTNDAYISAYQEISARLARHNTYPSFASSSASNASVYAMTYSGGQYTYTLTDSNGVLSPDFSSFSAPSGVTVTKNGNTLTITATEAAMASGEVTVSMTGRKMQAGTTYVWFAVDNEDTSIIYSSRQPLTTIEATSSVPAYFKLKADTKTVSIKKTSNASASVQACIQDNPLYTLAGAKYEIYEGTYPNGTLRETLTTDINGNAAGTVKYNIGTKLWAKEIVSPPGYLMPAEAQNHYPLTVSSGDNEFKVYDTPTFDPTALKIKKTGTDTETIQGTVFEVKYYAQYWIEDSKLRATWYFMSDANGVVDFDDAHLLSSYGGVNSDPLYKPYGEAQGPQLPLGCAVVKEVKAANGYVLPSGNTGRVCIFIKQGGPNPQNGAAAGAYWGDFAANPLDSNHPKDIYRIENDSQKQTVTAVNEEAYGAPFEVVKTDESNVKLEGAVFKVEYYNSSYMEAGKLEKTWYFKTDSNGYFTLDAAHRLNNSEYQSDTLFETGKIPLGIMAVTEVKAPTGFVKADFTGLWRMKLSDDKTAVDCYWAASNGYTPTTSYGDVAYVLDTEPDKLYVKNTSIPSTPISIKKTSNATASELACIQGNPLYSLAGAKYQIYEGTYPNGTLRETLTTDANGNATGTVTYYADGTVKLYAIETVAPAGYLLNSTPVALTVTTSNHVFNVSDVPTFDTNALKIKKTGSANEKIQGAVFKATFYASNWMDSTQRKRTWYFQSDENGIVKFDDTHLLSSYNGETSSALYKPNGSTAKFPLGCVYVEEVEAANGYILPTGGTGGVCIFIRQGGTKVSQNGKPAGAYWGDGDANPLSTTNPKGIYKIENDAQNQTVTAVNETAYGAPFKVVKTDESDVKLEGAIFRVQYYNADGIFSADTVEKTWYFVTDTNGYFTLDAAHLLNNSQYHSDTLFPDGKIPLGLMTVKEVKSPTGFLLTNFTGYWRMRRASNQIDVECLWVTVDGSTPALGYGSLAYILDEEPDKLYVKNKPLELKIVKTSTDGKVNNIDFVVDIKNDANEWDNIGTFTTGTDGKIDVPKQYLIQGATYRITEIVPENYICTTQNPQTVTLNRATTTVNFSNKPFSGLEIIKTSPDGNIANIEFVIEKQVPLGHGEYTTWEILDPKNPTYLTNEKGKIVIDDDAVVETGMVLRITENVPDGYICTSENPKTITLSLGKNSVTFENIPVAKLSLVKRSDDGKVDGIQFKLEKKQMTGTTGPTQRERWDLIGTYTTHDGGIILPEEFGALDYDGIYRVTEIVPQGYICENPVQTFTAGIDSEGNPVTEHQVTFENRRIYGNLEITKVDESYPDHKLTGAEFTVTMTTFGSSEQKTKIMTEVLDEQGNGTGVYRLEGIEYGTICEIRETAAPEGYELSDEVWRVTILEEKTYTITTPNFEAVINRQIAGQISVHKEDAEHNAMSGVQFLLEYSMDNGATWAPIQARTAEDPILPGYCTSEGLTDGILTTGADGNIVFTGLALSTEINSNVTYRLTEVKTQNGNTLMGISVFEGPLTIEEPELSYKVVNESVFSMPRTGSNGFVGTGIAIGLAILAALIILLNLPRGKKIKRKSFEREELRT